MTFQRTFLTLGLFALLLALTACGPSNTLHLMPLKSSSTVLPAPSAPTIAVVKFNDKRVETMALGLRRDNSYFTSTADPADWVSTAIIDRLSSMGYQVSYAKNASEAMRARPDYILNGSIEKLEVNETSAASYECKISVTYALANKDKIVLRQPYSASGSKTTFPGNSAVENLLAETLKTIIDNMATKVEGKVKH